MHFKWCLYKICECVKNCSSLQAAPQTLTGTLWPLGRASAWRWYKVFIDECLAILPHFISRALRWERHSRCQNYLLAHLTHTLPLCETSIPQLSVALHPNAWVPTEWGCLGTGSWPEPGSSFSSHCGTQHSLPSLCSSTIELTQREHPRRYCV